MAAYSSDGSLQFGAVIDRAKVLASPPSHNILCRIWPDDAFITVELPAFSQTLQVRYDDIHKLLVHPSQSWMALAVDRFPRVFPLGDKRFRKPVMPDASIWSYERTLILFLEKGEWYEHLSVLLPVEELDACTVIGPSKSLQLPSDFEKLYLLDVICHASAFRLTQESVDVLAQMPLDDLLVEVAAIISACDRDVLTDLVPLHAMIGTQRNKLVAWRIPTPHHHLIRHCVVNPFEVIPMFPYFVQSSRLLDMCAELEVVDYLLVVAFTEVSGERISKQVSEKVEEVFQNGLLVAGRQYSFLAASSDQLRHGSSWFFCESNPKGITIQSLRHQIGDLSEITNQVKFLSRLGLALSTSRPICDLKGAISISGDVIHDDHNFTEGCGEMSTELADCISKELGLAVVISAVQVRIGGCKGVLVRNSILKGKQAKIRRSMIKFKSDDTILRVVSIAQAGPLSLNHDVLTLLGPHVPDCTWQSLLQEELLSLAGPLYASSTTGLPKHLIERFLSALSPVITRTTFMQTSLNLWNDPLCLNTMRGVYLGCIMDLCERMHIPIKAGVMLMGVADPTGTLAPHEVAFTWNDVCYEGSVIIYRNPMSHPGDVRKLVAVKRAELEDLDGVLVFSIQPEEPGAPPQFAKCSGGDLDGDQYAVLFDIEPTEDVRSGDERRATDVLSRPLDMQSLSMDEYVDYGTSFADISEAKAFLQIALNYVLGQVSNAHKAMADQSADGAYDASCLTLAAMAYLAVDAPKTGDVVKVPPELKSEQYPDWMLNHSKPAYASNKVLGKLFRTVKDLQYVSVLDHDFSLDQYHCTSYIPVVTGSDAQLVDQIADIFSQYVSKMNVALAGWGLRNEVEMLVGPLKKKLTRFDFHRHRKRIIKTQAVLEQLCEEFADRFDEVLASSSKPLATVVAAWWSTDSTGLSAFRWVPWRRHSAAIGEVVTIQASHQIVSAPLARLGADILDGHSCGRDVTVAFIVRKTVEHFLIAALDELFSLHAAEGASETVQTCINALCGDFEFISEAPGQQGVEMAMPDCLLFQQECGRTLVGAIVHLPHLARSQSEAISSALQNRFGCIASMVVMQLQRLLQCHAHRLTIWLDYKSLKQPMHFHQQLYSLSLKQQQMLMVTQVFVKELRSCTGAQIRMQNIEKGLRKRPVRSLLVSGTLAQLFKVERELHRLENTPMVRTLKFDNVVASVRFAAAVNCRASVALSDAAFSIHPIHQRKKVITSDFSIASSVLEEQDFFGGPSLSSLLRCRICEPFEMLEISVKIGSFYILGAPPQLLGPTPDRTLTAKELVDLLMGNRQQKVDVEITPGGRGRKGKGKGKGGRPFVIHFLRSGFNATLHSVPTIFFPTLTSVSLKFQEKATKTALSLEFNGKCTEVACLRKEERRTMMYTECQLASEGTSWRGDLRVVANASTLVGEHDDLYVAVESKPPVRLPEGGALDASKEWYCDLRLNTTDYEFEIIRVHNRMVKSCAALDGCQFEIDHVVSLVPDGLGVAIESDLYEISMRFDPVLGAEVEVEELDKSVHCAIQELRQLLCELSL